RGYAKVSSIVEAPTRNPEKMTQHIIDTIARLIPANVDRVLKDMNFKSGISERINNTICALCNLFEGNDETSSEINPFVLTKKGHYLCD
ncbi:MAG: ATP-grasp domain-containing protein, partial [Thermodesulfobacteriota bacterium]